MLPRDDLVHVLVLHIRHKDWIGTLFLSELEILLGAHHHQGGVSRRA
jgi:hypothetical protein